MKNKIVIFLALISIFVPSLSYALIMPPDPTPQANLTIIINSQEEEGFTFNLQSKDDNNADWDYFFKFHDETENLYYSRNITISPIDKEYWLEREISYGGITKYIHCVSDNKEAVFSYMIEGVIFTPKGGENIVCTFDNIKPQAKNPVLIVPGLLGTEIKKDNNLLWADIVNMVNPLNSDNFMDPLAFNKDLTPEDSSVYKNDIIKNPDGLFDYTDSLITEFTNQGYIENQNLFTFPYDWRYGVSGKYSDGKTNADLLGQKIQDILQQTGSDKVDIVAHSLGGLIVKEYVMNHPTDNNIGKAVFVGVPNTGAPKAVKVLSQGDNFGVTGLSDAEMKKISANMPATYDLLPSQQYYNTKGSFVQVIDDGSVVNSSQTKKDLNYSDSESFLTIDHSLNSQALSNAENLHTSGFDNYDLRTAGIDLYAIDGCKAGTLGKVVEVRYKDLLGNNSTVYDQPKETPGDNTVPLESATNLPIDANNKYYALVSSHGKMPSQDGIRQEIVNLISGSNLNVSSNLVTQDISKCNLKGKAISVFSPVNVFVTDQSGDKLGLADDGSIINEIPNADFEVMGDHKFIYLPQDDGQTYNVNLTGTDSGTFTIKNQDINNDQVTGTEVFSNLPVTPQLSGQININPTDNTTTLSLNDSPSPVLPSATIDANSSEDVLPPVSVATFTGTVSQPGFYRSDVSLNLKATDDISGVLDVEYNLDNTGFQKISGDTATVKILSEGKHTLVFFSTDKMGNNEPEKTVNFTIDKTAPEAVVQFDQDTKDLKFIATDNISDSSLVSVKDNDDTITLADQAGNTTEIKLKDKNRKILMAGEIKSLKYNGVAADISKNLMVYSWFYDKKKNLTALSQHVQSRKGYNVLAVYDGNKTTLVGKDASGIILKSFSGLKIIKITTNKGDLGWSY